MATTTHKIVGKAMWARVFEANRDMVGFEGGAKETDGQYQIGLVLDKAGRLALKASGSALQIKFDDDGNVKPVTFRRDHKHRLYDWAGGAPKVTKADGTAWNQETDGFINNDSEVEVSFTVYTTTKANGTRLESVKVLVAAEREEKEEAPKTSAPVMSSTGEEEVPF